MEILVAGGAGYVGSALIPKLLDRGYQVDVVELFWFGNHLPEQVDVVHKDIFDLSVQDLRGYEQVVFLAGLSNDPMAEFSPSKNFIFNAAAVSKLAGEGMVGLTWERSFVVRTCGLYGVTGSSGKGGNFVETMLRKAAEKNPIRVVDDQVLTLLSRETWGMPSVCFVRTDNYGIYHVSAEGQCSWYEFARKIFELKGLRVDLKPVSTAEFPSPVRRPAYSVLGKKRLRSIGIEMPSWEEGLGQYLTARKSKTQTIKAASL